MVYDKDAAISLSLFKFFKILNVRRFASFPLLLVFQLIAYYRPAGLPL